MTEDGMDNDLPRRVDPVYYADRSGAIVLYSGDVEVLDEGAREHYRGELALRLQTGGTVDRRVSMGDQGHGRFGTDARIVGLPAGACSRPVRKPPLEGFVEHVLPASPLQGGDVSDAERIVVHVTGELTSWLPEVDVQGGGSQPRVDFDLLGWPATFVAIFRPGRERDPAEFSHLVEITLPDDERGDDEVEMRLNCLFPLLSQRCSGTGSSGPPQPQRTGSTGSRWSRRGPRPGRGCRRRRQERERRHRQRPRPNHNRRKQRCPTATPRRNGHRYRRRGGEFRARINALTCMVVHHDRLLRRSPPASRGSKGRWPRTASVDAVARGLCSRSHLDARQSVARGVVEMADPQAELVTRDIGKITAVFHDIDRSRSIPWKRRPRAQELLAEMRLPRPQRRFDAVAVGEPPPALGDPLQTATILPVFVHLGIPLYVQRLRLRTTPSPIRLVARFPASFAASTLMGTVRRVRQARPGP